MSHSLRPPHLKLPIVAGIMVVIIAIVACIALCLIWQRRRRCARIDCHREVGGHDNSSDPQVGRPSSGSIPDIEAPPEDPPPYETEFSANGHSIPP
ncbi:hypothetical protein C8J56DRAFT_1045224 [Mycena floridula]|nr:hypothetical protein C8J56DRAFT_1045224 [Mycena floridula]